MADERKKTRIDGIDVINADGKGLHKIIFGTEKKEDKRPKQIEDHKKIHCF